ncbi:hypothetical protein BDV06DRAFT_217070 [Aspergillus oleicola]
MSGMPWELVAPKVVGASTKDIICKLAGLLTVSGGKGRVIESFGPGTQTMEAMAMATVCSISAEIGSISCIFPYNDAMGRYLEATQRAHATERVQEVRASLLTADEGADSYYDQVIEIDLSSLEPHVNGPYTPDLVHPISKLKNAVAGEDWLVNLSHAMVGSYTSSSYEDLDKTRQIVAQARAVEPQTEADGILSELRDAGAVVLNSSCGPCVGSWDRKDVDVRGKEKNSVVSSFNRNFIGRHDSNPATHASDCVPGSQSGELQLHPPVSQELPASFTAGNGSFQEPSSNGDELSVNIRPGSDRLQLLEPFLPWQPGCADEMELLMKVKGECTTDHVSPAGPCNNMLTTAINAFLEQGNQSLLGHIRHPITTDVEVVPQVARDLKRRSVRSCIVGDNNYGEGSSREHAALEPRYLGGVAVIARSFARIHETNLKKQGMLPLTFVDPAAYDRIAEGDRITLVGVEEGELAPGSQVTMRVRTRSGETWEAELVHSYHSGQIPWLRAGSALNHIKATTLAH